MTDWDVPVDSSSLLRTLIAEHRLTLFRLARARYANLSGAGAAAIGGRWNHLGVEAIYTSTEKGVPLLERLVHTPKEVIPSNLAMMTIELSGKWIPRTEQTLEEADTGAQVAIYPTLREASSAHATGVLGADVRFLAAIIPSVIVPVWNLVLYPQAFGFSRFVSLRDLRPFEFDARLFPVGATPESP